ncbi:MAG: aldo/keto reductase [Armatimonadota bacterium]
MEYRQLGRSGCRVSPICLGTMHFGNRTDEKTAIEVVNTALDNGINFIDTADVYKTGVSEEFTGEALAQNGRRDDVVLATKAVWKMGDGPNDHGASRYHLIRAVEDSLRRLQTDRIDLFYLHVVDITTPMDEILQTIDTLIQQGKIIYWGTSKHPATMVTELAMRAKYEGIPQPVAEQSPYNFLDRTLENDLAWTSLRHGIGLCVFGPLARGVLSGKYKREEEAPDGSRLSSDNPMLTDEVFDALDKLRPIADGYDCTMAEFALAWVIEKAFISSALVGSRIPEHIESAAKAVDVEISDSDLEAMDQIVAPGEDLTGHYDRPILQKVRQSVLSKNWRTYTWINGETPTGTERTNIE